MFIPRQAQVLLSFTEQVVRAINYNPCDLEQKGKLLTTFEYKQASDMVGEDGLWLDLYCRPGPEAKPQQVAGLMFDHGVLSEIICDANKCFGRDDFSAGLELMEGLVNLAKRSACAADVSFYDFSYKVTSMKKQRVNGILLGPSNPTVGARSVRNYARIAEVVVDQQAGRLLSFRSLYKAK